MRLRLRPGGGVNHQNWRKPKHGASTVRWFKHPAQIQYYLRARPQNLLGAHDLSPIGMISNTSAREARLGYFEPARPPLQPRTDLGFVGRVTPRLTEGALQRIVQSLLPVANPAAIILFGSYARGDVHPYSDIDLLVLRRQSFRAGESRRKELGNIYRSVTEVCDVPKDIILFTLDEFYLWRETTNHMVAIAWKEGRLLYGQV